MALWQTLSAVGTIKSNTLNRSGLNSLESDPRTPPLSPGACSLTAWLGLLLLSALLLLSILLSSPSLSFSSYCLPTPTTPHSSSFVLPTHPCPPSVGLTGALRWPLSGLVLASRWFQLGLWLHFGSLLVVGLLWFSLGPSPVISSWSSKPPWVAS